MSEAAIIQGQLVDARNVGVHKSFRLVIDVPAEHAAMVIEKLGWPTQASPIPVAVARLATPIENIGNDVDVGEAISPSCPGQASPSLSPDKPLKERKPVAIEKRLAQQAGILCNDPLFWHFLNETSPAIPNGCKVASAEDAKHVVYARCGVASRADIIPGTPAATDWASLASDFVLWRDHPELVAP